MPKLKADLDVLRDVLRGRALQELRDEPLAVQITHPIRIGSISFTPTTALSIGVAIRVESACVKYAHSAKASARLPFTSASSEIEFTDYRKHRATDSAWDALRNDLAAPRSILELDDVRKLQPGDALAMEIGGTLSASVSFSWADAIAAKHDELGELVPVLLKLKSGLEASATVRVKDQFLVRIGRTKEQRFRIAVKKARSRNHVLAIEAALGAEAKIEDMLDAIPVPEELRDELRKRLKKIAQWKASTGFAYEYARIDENESIAEYDLLDESLLAEDHARAIAGEVDLLHNPEARAILKYLNETTRTRRSTSGFSFGFVAAKDESTFKQTTRTSLDGFRLITSRGTRKYDEKNIPQNDFEWTVDLKSQMTEFLESPTTLDFDYGLQYVVTLERNAFTEDDLARVLDFAAMWDICAPPAEEFAEVLHHKATARIQLTFDRDALLSSRALSLSKGRDLAGWAAPLAMAMPYMTTFAERKTFTSRLATYERAWQSWLEGQTTHLRGFFEERALPGSFAWTSGTGHPQLRERLDSFMRGMNKLHDVMTNARPPEEIGDAYDALQRFWSQRLYIAASGRWLLDRARDAGLEPARSLQINYADSVILSRADGEGSRLRRP